MKLNILVLVVILAAIMIMTGCQIAKKSNQNVDINQQEEIDVSESGEPVNISVINKIKKANLWVLKDTEENRKVTVWGPATVSDFDVELEQAITVYADTAEQNHRFVINMIDEGEMYYSACEVVLEDGYRMVIREGEEIMSAFVDVYDEKENLIAQYEMFVARL